MAAGLRSRAVVQPAILGFFPHFFLALHILPIPFRGISWPAGRHPYQACMAHNPFFSILRVVVRIPPRPRLVLSLCFPISHLLGLEVLSGHALQRTPRLFCPPNQSPSVSPAGAPMATPPRNIRICLFFAIRRGELNYGLLQHSSVERRSVTKRVFSFCGDRIGFWIRLPLLPLSSLPNLFP